MFPKSIFACYFVGFDYSSRIFTTGNINFYQNLFRKADFIFAKSQFSKQTIIGLGCDKSKVKIDYNGININKFNTREIKVFSNEIVKFIIVSRLEIKKSHVLILQALTAVSENYTNFEFTIIGDGPESKKIEKYIEETPILHNKIKLLGRKSQYEISSILNESHVFIHPSSTALDNGNMEDTPTAILEAMACGLPIISTYHAGIPDLVIENYNGKMVPERNLNYLISSIMFFMENTDEIPRMGKHSRIMVEEKFDTISNSQKLEELFLNKQLC
jgi:colanic acid/amylovoran biosynthesis glycosyltransferase